MRAAPLLKLAGLWVRQGRFEEAERLLEGYESRPEPRPVLAALALARGDLALAEDLARLCLEREDASDPACAPLLELLVDVQLARNDLPAASDALDRLTALASGSGDERVSAAASFMAGRLLAAQGDERARSHLHAALEGFAQLDLPHEAARAQLELARSLASDARAGAASEARSALATFERIGARRDADAAAELLRNLGEAGGRAWPKRHGTLTRRETEVLSLLAGGCSNAEIAERLYISKRTAEHHVASILSKLELRSRAEAAAYAVREQSETPVGE
jgi:DNA-binding NarL/FixJ family response regulator